MLRDVKHTVTDGLLGFSASSGDGKHVKIGVSPIVSSAPIIMTGEMDAAKVKSRLGLSPLADAMMDSIQFGAGRTYCFPVAASTAGTVGEVTKEGAGDGTVTADGSPTNAFSVIVKITGAGGLNSAAFIYSIDGGYSFSDEISVPVSGSYELEGTGLTVQFIAGEEDGALFQVGDIFRFATTAPVMTNADVLAAIDRLKEFSEEFEFVHIVGESALALWQAVSTARQELFETYHKPVFFLMEAVAPADDADLTDWAFQMEADRKKVKDCDIQVCAHWGRLVKLDGTTQIVNLAGVAAGLYAKAKVQVSIGKTRPEAGFGISKDVLLELLPEGMDSTVIQMLDKAGYLTFREYDGLDDFYVYHTKMMCPDGSDFRYAEDVRVKNKIIRETRKEALKFLNDDIDLEDVQGELETRAKFITTPLDQMVEDKEISSYEVTVPEGQEETILEDETMRVKIRYVSRGYIREIEVDLGRSQPSSD